MDEATEYRPISVNPPTAVKKDRTKLIIFLIIAIIFVGSYFFFKNSTNKEEQITQEKVVVPTIKEKPSPTPEEELTESPTPEDKETTPSPIPTTGKIASAKDLNVQVLNGSGAEGVAGTGKTYLTDKGYKNLFTGNADNFDYENVTINIKDSRKSYADTIKQDLSGEYTVNDDIGTLDASSQYDVQVIIGK